MRFAEYGANVAINYLRQPGEAAETAEQVHACTARVQQKGVRDALVQGDVSREDDVVAMVGQAVAELEGIDVLINNAGIQISAPGATSSQARTLTRSSPSTFAALLRARGDPSLPCRAKARSHRQRLKRPPGDPQARLPRLLG